MGTNLVEISIGRGFSALKGFTLRHNFSTAVSYQQRLHKSATVQGLSLSGMRHPGGTLVVLDVDGCRYRFNASTTIGKPSWRHA